MQNFNPVVFNCALLYVTVVLLSILQSRFRIIIDNPTWFFILLIVTPLLMYAKAAKVKTWTELTGFEIFAWTLMLAYFNPKRILPRINEGYIYAYTLFHWYLLIDTITIEGIRFWLGFVLVLSIYPTVLIIKSTLEHKLLTYSNKLILYYWFLFAVIFTYIDQVAMDIIHPILALPEINFISTAYVLITAAQLYFISTTLSLLFVGIPFFHLDRSFDKWRVRWARAKRDWKEIVKHKLGNYVEYQISGLQLFYISLLSAFLFYLDFTYGIRLYLIFFYTVLFPIIFFYMKYTPEANVDEL